MASKARIRVVVSLGGALRQLFFIRDRGAEGPMIVLRSGDTLDDPIAGDLDILEERMSFHPSNNSEVPGLTTLTCTLVTKTGQIADGRAEVPINSKRDCWIFFAMRAQELSPDKYICAPKAKDSIIQLPTHDNIVCSLVYYLIAAHPEVEISEIEKLGYRFEIIRFRSISIIIYYAYMGMPPLPSGSQMFVMTSFPRENKRREIEINIKSRPKDISDLRSDFTRVQSNIVAHTHKKIAEFLDNSPEEFTKELDGILYKTSCMLLTDPIYAERGRVGG